MLSLLPCRALCLLRHAVPRCACCALSHLHHPPALPSAHAPLARLPLRCSLLVCLFVLLHRSGKVGKVTQILQMRLGEKAPRQRKSNVAAGLLLRSMRRDERWLEFKVCGVEWCSVVWDEVVWCGAAGRQGRRRQGDAAEVEEALWPLGWLQQKTDSGVVCSGDD